MNPISITPVITDLPKKVSILSNHAQRVLKSQIKSVTLSLEKFFLNLNPELGAQNEKNFKEIGFKHIGKNKEEGVILNDNKFDYHIFSSNNNTLSINVLKSDTNEVYQHICFNNDSDGYIHAGKFSESNIEEKMSEIIDFIDRKLTKTRLTFTQNKAPQLYIPRPKTSEMVEELNKIARHLPKNAAIKDYGYIDNNVKMLIKSIIHKYQTLKELYSDIPEGRSRSKVRSNFKHYIPHAENNTIGFKNIGLHGEDIRLSYISYKHDKYVAVGITNINGKESKFVISEEKGTIQRNLPYRFSVSGSKENRIYAIPDYYTQKEIDSSNFSAYLAKLDKELQLFIEHTRDCINKRNELRLLRENNDIATLEQYKDLLDAVYSEFKNYRAKMRKYLRKPHKSTKFKTENNISTKLASTAVKFNNITSEGEDLRLSYPKIHDKIATQLLIMQDDKIKKSFFILNNKLVRFNIKDLNDRFPHDDRSILYYDNNYLRESDLENYFLLLRDKLKDLNEKLDKIREKQLENRVKYNLKPSKEEIQANMNIK